MKNFFTCASLTSRVLLSLCVIVFAMIVIGTYSPLETQFGGVSAFAAYGQSGSGGGSGAGGSDNAGGGAGSGGGGGDIGGGADDSAEGDGDGDTQGSGGGNDSGGSIPGSGSGGSDNAGGGAGSGGGSGGGGGEEPVVGNNESFPFVAADGFGVTAITSPTFQTVYDGPYTGLSIEERLLLEGHTWYAQKTEGNIWQPEYVVNPIGDTISVFGVDWGDNIEAVNPVIGRPFRLEVTLYHAPAEPMEGYTMALLAFPSSPNEVQGTNGETYESEFATIVSPKPKMVVQLLEGVESDDLTWTGEEWEDESLELPVTELSFASELNVGGKYIFGASKGGWKPEDAGTYRLTFYAPESDISFEDAVIGNYADWATTSEVAEETETRAATPVVDAENNLTYVDVVVVTKRDGGKPENPGEDGEESTSLDALSMTSESEEGVEKGGSVCTPYLSDYLAMGQDNDSDQVVLLQEFLNETMGTNIPTTGYFGPLTLDGVKLFQRKYADEVLQPWQDAGHTDVSLTEGTGVVYITTASQINKMKCKPADA